MKVKQTQVKDLLSDTKKRLETDLKWAAERRAAVADGFKYNIPQELIEGLILYRDEIIKPGGYLTAILENNLFDAVGKGDTVNLLVLKELCVYIYHELPGDIWGSKEIVEKYLANPIKAQLEVIQVMGK